MSPSHNSSMSPITPPIVAIPLSAAVIRRGDRESGGLLPDKKSFRSEAALASGIICPASGFKERRVDMTITWFSRWRTRNFLRERGGESGITLIELLVAIGIISILVAVAVPNINSSQMNLTTATEEVSGDLRIARANATGRGRHYRITFGSASYSVERLEAIVDGDGNKTWVPDGSPRTSNTSSVSP